MIRKHLYRLSVVWLLGGLLATAALAAAAAPQIDGSRRVAVAAKGRPLGEVLDKLGRETGRQFVLDPAWRSHPVSVEFQDTPLDTALRRILDGLNSSIIYRPDTTIRLIIIGTPPATGEAAAGAPPPKTSLRRPIDRGPVTSPRGSLPPPPPPVQAPPAEEPQANPPEGKPEDADE